MTKAIIEQNDAMVIGGKTTGLNARFNKDRSQEAFINQMQAVSNRQ